MHNLQHVRCLGWTGRAQQGIEQALIFDALLERLPFVAQLARRDGNLNVIGVSEWQRTGPDDIALRPIWPLAGNAPVHRIEWVPVSYYVDSANSVRTEPYALLGAKVGYDNGQWFSAYVEGRNLTNVKYIASASIAERANAASVLFEPGNGIGVFGGVKFRLN